MNMARYEQETIISFNEEEKTAGIYTHNKMPVSYTHLRAHET